MNFEVFVLGTSGMMPLPNRYLTSAMVRRDGDLFLFDCGEGTQVSLKMLNLKWKKIHSIFISHMHADHVTGLPGMLMLSSQVDRDEPLTLYGPAKLKEYIDANRRILDMYINYEIIVKVAQPGVILETDEFTVSAFPLSHTKPCVGYVMKEKDRPGEFHPQRAKELGVPMGPLWGKLQKGESVSLTDGSVVHASQVVGEKREGRTFSYVTDTLYLPSIVEQVRHSDLLLCEGMFGDDMLETALEKKHMTASQAATIAKEAEVRQLGLLHYSPRYSDGELRYLLKDARSVFGPTVLTRDRMVFEIPLKD
ncbi:ribonuclease Z [Sphaerochaeta sp.]|uniref:ribonuclease Z n=1 Tax=Sphaerochaeta sp. TaxID=1972642 RepID=UPI002FCA1F91